MGMSYPGQCDRQTFLCSLKTGAEPLWGEGRALCNPPKTHIEPGSRNGMSVLRSSASATSNGHWQQKTQTHLLQCTQSPAVCNCTLDLGGGPPMCVSKSPMPTCPGVITISFWSPIQPTLVVLALSWVKTNSKIGACTVPLLRVSCVIASGDRRGEILEHFVTPYLHLTGIPCPVYDLISVEPGRWGLKNPEEKQL